MTARDKLAVQWTHDKMKQVVVEFSELSEEEARDRFNLGRDVQDWKVRWAQADVRSHPDTNRYVTPVLYRPFDRRWTYYTGQSRGFICRPRSKIMRHIVAGPNVGLSTTRSTEIVGGWEHILASRLLIQHHTVSLKEVNYLFPLYTYPEERQGHFVSERQSNLDDGFVEALGSSLSLDFTSDGSGDLRTSFGPEDVLHYVYAVLHSPEYRRRYADFLKSDFPRVPTGNLELFSALVGLGERAASLHLMESEGHERPAFREAGDNCVKRVGYVPPSGDAQGRVYINAGQYFDGISPETWEFTIGGYYQPAEKWLKDRRRRTLTFDEIAHYQRLCAALAETPRLMSRIDEVIASHGGWPLG